MSPGRDGAVLLIDHDVVGAGGGRRLRRQRRRDRGPQADAGLAAAEGVAELAGARHPRIVPCRAWNAPRARGVSSSDMAAPETSDLTAYGDAARGAPALRGRPRSPRRGVRAHERALAPPALPRPQAAPEPRGADVPDRRRPALGTPPSPRSIPTTARSSASRATRPSPSCRAPPTSPCFVVDAWQGQGIATMLARRLVEHADAQGVARLAGLDVRGEPPGARRPAAARLHHAGDRRRRRRARAARAGRG